MQHQQHQQHQLVRITINLPQRLLDQIKDIAWARKKKYQVMMREWLEHMATAEAAPPPTAPPPPASKATVGGANAAIATPKSATPKPATPKAAAALPDYGPNSPNSFRSQMLYRDIVSSDPGGYPEEVPSEPEFGPDVSSEDMAAAEAMS